METSFSQGVDHTSGYQRVAVGHQCRGKGAFEDVGRIKSEGAFRVVVIFWKFPDERLPKSTGSWRVLVVMLP